MTKIGLYLVGENQEIQRMRRAYAPHLDGKVHLVPDGDTKPSLCGGLSASGRPWTWTDAAIDCGKCLNLISEKLVDHTMAFGPADLPRRKTSRRFSDLYLERDYDDLSPEWTIG